MSGHEKAPAGVGTPSEAANTKPGQVKGSTFILAIEGRTYKAERIFSSKRRGCNADTRRTKEVKELCGMAV